MDARFGPAERKDFAGRLSKLRQMALVLDYQSEFQWLSNRVKGLSEAYLINLHLSGLRDDVLIGAHKLNPTNLPEAFSLARLQEEEANLRRQMFKTEVGHLNMMPNPSESRPSLRVIKRLTPAKARDQRLKGLYYNYDEKYTPNHRCKTQKLFWVEAMIQDEKEGVDHDLDALGSSAHNETPEDDASSNLCPCYC